MLKIFIFSLLVFWVSGQSTFYQVFTDTPGPLPRGTWASARISDSTVYFFGGAVDNETSGVYIFYNDTWRFDYLGDDQGVWTQLFPDGPAPSSRAFHSLAVLKDCDGKDHMCLFGGTVYSALSGNTSTDTFYCMDLSTTTWTNLTSLGGPGPRSGSRVIADGSKMYVIGGVNKFSQTLSQVWRFDLCSLEWENLTPTTGPTLPPRHVMVGGLVKARGQDRLVVYGGETIDFLPFFHFGLAPDTWEFDILTNQWVNTTRAEQPIPPRNYACSVVDHSHHKVVMFGGDRPGKTGNCTDKQNPSNDIWDYSASNKKWTQRSTLDAPPGVKRHTCEKLIVDYEENLFVFGGFQIECRVPGAHSFQVFPLEVWRVEL